ncbi:MAG: hypothetical protein IJS73_03265 [Paludibacteraceae bacterium]|nr:hypothetical protein [Paludibacteraceae bacterium]
MKHLSRKLFPSATFLCHTMSKCRLAAYHSPTYKFSHCLFNHLDQSITKRQRRSLFA